MPRKPYKSDLTDAEWIIIEPLIPPAKKGGYPRTVNMREIINGMFYVLKTGCSWEMLPHDLPSSSTVYSYFRLFQKKGRLDRFPNCPKIVQTDPSGNCRFVRKNFRNPRRNLFVTQVVVSIRFLKNHRYKSVTPPENRKKEFSIHRLRKT